MLLHDALDASTARICADGCLVADVLAARTGIQQYRGYEVDPQNAHGLRDKDVVNVYRPADEVFARDSLASFAAAPVTIDHPAEMVSADNWRQLGVGEINGDIARDGERVRVPLIVRDAAAVRKAQTTHKQLSMGYSTKLDFTPGTAPDGTAYDAVQREIRINHIALVPVARGGPELRIIDERPSEKPSMKITIGDAKDVDLSDGAAVALAVGALNTSLADAQAKVGTLTADLSTANTALQAKDGEIAGLQQQLADAQVTPEKLQQMADARAEVIGKAKALAPTIATDGKTEAEIRKAAVQAKLGDKAAAMTDAAIEGAFAVLTADAKPVAPRIEPIGTPLVTGDAAAKETAAFAKANDFNSWRTAGRA
ncbi:DUF2213 domain-containing protein [Sphingomonas sp.]|uniref:DUF2213 domain-containing protein n=1 Tax=Sphingomonas sp. TaxID=28214 RepID=UPI002FDA61CA